jgi:argininosuccinate lyase
MHTSRSRNDQVATDLRLYIKDATKTIENLLNNFQKILVKKANDNIDVVMPGFTHLQPLAAHHLLAYVYMSQRDKERLEDCYKRVETLCLWEARL